MCCCGNDAVDEEKIILCCACCCAHCGLYTGCDCPGCSGKIGICCLNCAICCKPGAGCLPLGCCGPSCEFDGCAILKIQLQAFCLAVTAAIPCDEEVPPAVSVLGLTVYPKVGCCMPIKEAIARD
eukprot:Nitzschia sp. Nitz4//scaffold5_size260463//63911//64593//NITZ4_000959-RA/size260463-exonerate_est2genome-gene-0.272-mRNA-1//1//CDS//3329555271//7398//frame0